MTVPVSVTSTTIHYTRDALRCRIDDLVLAATELSVASTAIAGRSGPLGDPRWTTLSWDIDCAVRHIAQLANDLDEVVARLEIDETTRTHLASLVQRVETTTPITISHVGSAVLGLSPWHDAATPFVPIVTTGTTTVGTGPRSVAERIDRIPHGDSPIRIERYESDSGSRFEVYIAGTDFAATPTNPWWAGGNIELLEVGQSRAMSAVEAALRQSGVTPSTPLVLTGHSQGGAIAMAIASSGRYAIDGVITVGSPIALVSEERQFPSVHIVHPADPVPTLASRLTDSAGTTWFVHPESRVVGTAAHATSTYVDSARAMENLGDPDMEAIANLSSGNIAGTATWFRAATSG